MCSVSEIGLSENQKGKSEKFFKDFRCCNSREVKESLTYLAKQVDLDLIKYTQLSDGALRGKCPST